MKAPASKGGAEICDQVCLISRLEREVEGQTQMLLVVCSCYKPEKLAPKRTREQTVYVATQCNIYPITLLLKHFGGHQKALGRCHVSPLHCTSRNLKHAGPCVRKALSIHHLHPLAEKWWARNTQLREVKPLAQGHTFCMDGTAGLTLVL